MSRAATTVYISQIVPLNKGVPLLSPISWPYISAPYDDSSHRYSDVTTIKSAFTNVSLNPRIITIGNTELYTAGVKSINCYEIHNKPTTTVNANSVFEISNIQSGANVDSILNRLYPYDTDIESYLTVSASTRSNRISLEGQGALSSMISSGSFDTDYDYFVLIHADDAKKHHLAKITELHTYETFGDGFDFSPAFDGDIPKDTKISIYKGPSSADTHIVAVGYGLLGDADDSDGRHDTYVEVSRPTFYFYEDRCSKDTLLPNTKYRVIKNTAYEISSTLKLDFGFKNGASQSDVGSTPALSAHGTTVHFLTTSDFGAYIIDKTGYSQYGELVDNLASADRTISVLADSSYSNAISNRTPTSNWSTNAYNLTTAIELGTWGSCFINTMRDKHTSNGASSGTYDSDIKRLVTYEDSDLKNYHLPHIQYIDLFDSVASIGNFMEMKFPDANKILNLKLKNFDNVLVRKEIKSEDYSGAMNIPLSGIVNSSTTGWSLTFSKLTIEQDFRDIWGSSLIATENTNKLRVGNYVFAGDFLSDPVIGNDGYEQIFTISHYRNVLTDNTWTSVASNWDIPPINNETAFVYPFMSKKEVIVGSFDIDTEYDGTNVIRNGNIITNSDNFISNTEILIRDKELTGFTFELNYGDKNMKYVKPSFTNYDSYQIKTRINGATVDTDNVANNPSLYSFINGDILHLDNVFDGYIESIKSNIQGGIVSYDITGRDYTNRLIDTVVNRNYTHTSDYIYTTLSPEADMIAQTGTVYIQDFDIGTSTIVLSSNNTSMQALDFEVGDVLYCTILSQTKLLGIVSAISGGVIDGSGGFSLGTYWNGINRVAFTAGSHAREITLTEPTIYSSYNETYGASNLKYARKSISLGKALSVNTNDSIFPTSLTGCSNKGIVYTSGEKIDLFNTTVSNLVESSANESKYSIGYPISKIEGKKDNTNFADYRFSISSDKEETTTTQNHTISSLTEFAIASNQTLENSQSLFGLAPIFPVVLAKTSSNTSDTRITNGNGIYFVNTQGLASGGFLHLLNSETNSVGASITFSNPGYKNYTSGVDAIDYRLEDNFGSFIWRYTGLQRGKLFWDAEYMDKVWNLKKKDVILSNIGDNSWARNLMYGNNTPIYGYAISQRINYDGVGIDFGTENQFTTHYTKLGSIESRTGFYPVTGSRFWDTDKLSHDLVVTASSPYVRYYSTRTETFENRKSALKSYYPQPSRRNGISGNDYGLNFPFRARQSYESFDRNVENFYLFSTGDIYPDSYKRNNSIGYRDRNLEKYSLIIKKIGSESSNAIEHENYLGSIPSNLINDTSFETIPIESANINTSELRRFGLVRLVEVTYDWHFNEVDYENLPIKVEAPVTQYGIVLTTGSLYEHDDSLETGPSLSDWNTEPAVSDFGIEYISAHLVARAGEGPVGSEGFAYYKMDKGIDAGAVGSYVLYTDFINFDTGVSNIFGEYDIEKLGSTYGRNPFDDSEDDCFLTTSGIVEGELVSAINSGATELGRTAGTYNNISVTSASGTDLKLTVVVDGSGTVTSVVPYEYASAEITGVNVKHRGYDYTTSDDITITGSDIGGSDDVDISIPSDNLITEHRLYLNAETPIIWNRAIGSLTTKNREYTGELKYNNVEIDVSLLVSDLNSTNVKYGETPTLRGNKGSYENSLATSTGASITDKRIFNLGFIIGSAADDTGAANGDNAYLGSQENDSSPVAKTTGSKTDGYDLILPIYSHSEGVRSSPWDFYDKVSSSIGRYSTKSYDNNFELSRVMNELSQWDEDTVVGFTPSLYTNPIGVGASHLYTDTIGVIKALHLEAHSKIEYSNNRNNFQIDVSRYSGATIPNLHISYLQGDGFARYFSIKYAFDFTSVVSGEGWVSKQSEHSGSGLPNTEFALFNGSRYDYATNVDNMIGAEFYFKMVLNTNASNVTAFGLNGLTQTNGIPSSTSVKGNTQINSRAIIEITTPNLTTYDNNGKNAAIPTSKGTFNKNNIWINYVNDLTGHYLVSEPSDRVANDSYPNKIHYVVNHTINTEGATITHYLEIDNVEISGTPQLDNYYRVMRIAKDCTYSYSPNEIEILHLDKKYTKIPNKFECHTSVSRHNISPINGTGSEENSITNEAVLSMYAFLDVDGTGDVNNRQYVLRRNRGAMITSDGANNTLQSNTNKNMLITDGINDNKININFDIIDDNPIIKMPEMYNMKGIVSFGEIFNITAFKSSLNFGIKRCNLASSLEVVEEVDEIVNHILENNNVEYNTNYDTDTEMYFIGPNYTGISGFQAINNLLELKNKRFVVEGETIQGRDILSDGLYTNIILSENDESEGVVNLKIDTSSYDFYNEVIVYGDNARGIARNNQSIRDLDRKITLEITDLSLQTSKSAQDRANKELDIVQSLSSQVSFNVAKTRIPYLRAGQVITLDYPSLDVPTGYYQVLEIEDNFGQLPRITVGKYTQSLASRFADLSLKTREIQGVQRGNRFQEGNTLIQEAVIPEIKELNLKIIKTGTPSSTLGFSNTLGFSSELGFETGDSLVEEVIYNEDLTE